MSAEDREVLDFIGRAGKSLSAIDQRFPGFDVRRLIRARLVEERRFELAETEAHGPARHEHLLHYVLTERGARASGIDPFELSRD
jgi:hypothetical protein